MTDPTPPEQEPDPTGMLAAFIEAHGHAVTPYSGWLVVDGGAPPLSAKVFLRQQQGTFTVVQLDVLALVAPGEGGLLTESFAGVGHGARGALGNAFENFAANSLHVLLRGFFPGSENADDVHTAVGDWTAAGADGSERRWRAVIGTYGVLTVGEAPESPAGVVPADTQERLAALARAHPLLAAQADRAHWFRLYFARTPGRPDVREALFDNEPWPDGEAELSRLAWPTTGGFYSVRWFTLLLPHQNDGNQA